MISIPDCTQDEVEVILKVPPFVEWLRDVHSVIVEVIRHMIKPRIGATDDRTIERVQQISMHIWRHAQRVKMKCEGQLMNAQWSDQYFTINIPLNNAELFGVIRMERHNDLVQVNLGFPHPVEFMSHLGFSKLQERRVMYQGLNMNLKHVAFLVWCEHMKPGLSAPFKDMIEDNEL